MQPIAILSRLNENYGDNKDYSRDIEKIVKKWWKENADLGSRILKGPIEVKAEYTDDEFQKPYKYTCSMQGYLIDVQDWADEIGQYVSDNIQSVTYTGFKEFKADEDVDHMDGDVDLYFSQETGIPDFGNNI